MGENLYKCSPGPPDFTKVIVNAQGTFIRHYTVVCLRLTIIKVPIIFVLSPIG